MLNLQQALGTQHRQSWLLVRGFYCGQVYTGDAIRSHRRLLQLRLWLFDWDHFEMRDDFGLFPTRLQRNLLLLVLTDGLSRDAPTHDQATGGEIGPQINFGVGYFLERGVVPFGAPVFAATIGGDFPPELYLLPLELHAADLLLDAPVVLLLRRDSLLELPEVPLQGERFEQGRWRGAGVGAAQGRQVVVLRGLHFDYLHIINYYQRRKRAQGYSVEDGGYGIGTGKIGILDR